MEGAIEAEALAHAGAMLRKLRRERGLTVESLAAAAGISAGSISQLERGMGNPSFSTLFKLAYNLQVSLGIFDPADATGRKVVRKHERRRLQLAGEALTYELLTPDLQGDLQVLISKIPRSSTTPDNRSGIPGRSACTCCRAGSRWSSVRTRGTSWPRGTASPTTRTSLTGTGIRRMSRRK